MVEISLSKGKRNSFLLLNTSKVSKMIICKFNILDFKHEDEQASQKQFPRANSFENLSFCLAYENGQKKAQIRRPDLFPRASIRKGISFAVFTNFAATLRAWKRQ